MQERRAHPRVPATIPVRLKFEGAADFLASYTENISLGGISVPTDVDVPVGTLVDLTIEVMPGKGFKVIAEVAWSRSAGKEHPKGVGLRFTAVEEKHRRWLAQAVEKKHAELQQGN